MTADDRTKIIKMLATWSEDDLRDFIVYSIQALHARLMAKKHELIKGFILTSESDMTSWVISINIGFNIKPEGHKRYLQYLKELGGDINEKN